MSGLHPPHVPATAVKAHACVCKVARAVMCAYAGVSMKKGVADTNQTLISPERPPVRIYRVLLTAGPSRPPQHNVGCVSLAEGAETSLRMAPFFFIRTDRFLPWRPSALADAEERSHGARGRWNNTTFVKSHAYPWARICVCCRSGKGRDEAGGPCVLRHQDWLVPQRERERQEARIQRSAVKTTGSSSRQLDFHSADRVACLPACLPALHAHWNNINRWVKCDTLKPQNSCELWTLLPKDQNNGRKLII